MTEQMRILTQRLKEAPAIFRRLNRKLLLLLLARLVASVAFHNKGGQISPCIVEADCRRPIDEPELHPAFLEGNIVDAIYLVADVIVV